MLKLLPCLCPLTGMPGSRQESDSSVTPATERDVWLVHATGQGGRCAFDHPGDWRRNPEAHPALAKHGVPNLCLLGGPSEWGKDTHHPDFFPISLHMHSAHKCHIHMHGLGHRDIHIHAPVSISMHQHTWHSHTYTNTQVVSTYIYHHTCDIHMHTLGHTAMPTYTNTHIVSIYMHQNTFCVHIHAPIHVWCRAAICADFQPISAFVSHWYMTLPFMVEGCQQARCHVKAEARTTWSVTPSPQFSLLVMLQANTGPWDDCG